MTYCCSIKCERYGTCAKSCNQLPADGMYYTTEDYYNYGSTIIMYVNNAPKIQESYDCGPAGNWKMYESIYKPLKEEDYHQITMDELLEEKKSMDNIDVKTTISSYREIDYSLHMDHMNVTISSVPNYDELVKIEYGDMSLIVAASELQKAARLCSHNRW